jgi:hypothetical protein
MHEKLLVLERAIEEDLKVIEDLYDELRAAELGDSEPQEKLIVLGYRLHGLYNAFENIFRNVASSFANSLGEQAGWHQQLLQRMRLDLTPIRPALIDAATYERLDELRRFRHLFRSAYGLRLDALRLGIVLRKARELEHLYRPQLERFLEFLRALE